MATQPTPLDVIEEEARAVAQFFGIRACDIAAQMVARRVAERLGGQDVYLATGKYRKAHEHALVCRLFTGNNYAEVAKQVGISARQVRRIVAKNGALKK